VHAPLERLPSPSAILELLLLPLCLEADIPLLLRMGTRRGLNPGLGVVGDGVGKAHLSALGDLCAHNPKVKFVVAVLGASEHHEAAVLASRFRNVHLWGSWWYSNLPAVSAQSSAISLELLGPQFTFHASSARLHDQLISRWISARETLTRLLAQRYKALIATGWRVSRGDVRRDVQRLLGGAYTEFLAKKL